MLKVTKTQIKELNPIEYPCLGIFRETNKIVLFTSINTGTVMYSGNGEKVGRYSDCWNTNWVPYTGTITLTNEL